jgi:hypothetical protein
MHLIANTRPLDMQRAHRLLIAFTTGDKLACDTVLSEAAHDPIGTPGLLFALAQFAASLGEQVAPDFTGQLRAELLRVEDTEQ